MKIRPYGGMILVSRETSDSKTPGGLHIPESARKRLCRGEVLAVGPGRVSDHGAWLPITGIEPGDRIVWDRNGAHELPWDETMMLVSHEYVLANLDVA